MKQNQEQIKVLSIKEPWASLVADGFKTLEVRSRNTNIRGKIAIYATRTNPRNSELDYYFKFMSGMLKPIPPIQKGHIIATADIVDSYPVRTQEGFRTLYHNHLNPLSYYQEGLHFWELENVQKVEPVEFKFKGSVVWSSIDKSLLKISDYP